MTDGRWGVQAAVYQALAANSPSIAGGRIFAPARENYNPPAEGDMWISLEDGGAVQDDVTCMTGLETRLLVHVWQRATSFKAIREAISEVRDALHDVTLTVSGQDYAYSQVRSDDIIRDPDGLHLHGIVEVIVLHHS